MYHATSLTLSRFTQTWCTNICIIRHLKNRMSSISSNLYEGNRPITFHVSRCWIILKKNLVQWMELKSLDSLFWYEDLVRNKKIGDVIREEKWGKRKRKKKQMLKCSLLSRKYNNTHKHKSCVIPLLIKSQLWLQVVVWVGLGLNISSSF